MQEFNKSVTVPNILVGTDPEFGVQLYGKPASCIGILGGSKKEPKDIENGCTIQEDNVMGELTIPPCDKKEDFIRYINYGRKAMEEILFKNTGLPYKLVSLSSQEYPDDDLNNEAAMKFGCEPSYCIYTNGISKRPRPEDVGNLRSAGFHIHIGMPKLLNIEKRRALIYAMDILLGVPSIIIDSDEKRRKLYGNAGDFRIKLDGDKDYTIIEYRTLGAALHATDELIGWVYEQTHKAVSLFLTYPTMNKISQVLNVEPDYIRNIIDTGDFIEAQSLVDTLQIKLPENVLAHLVF